MTNQSDDEIERRQKPVELLCAAIDGDLTKLNALLDAGVTYDPNERRGNTLLMEAARYGQLEIVKALLARGEDGLAHHIYPWLRRAGYHAGADRSTVTASGPLRPVTIRACNG